MAEDVKLTRQCPYCCCDFVGVDCCCDDEDYDSDYREECFECCGTGEMPDNGTNMGECEECCGTGFVEY